MNKRAIALLNATGSLLVLCGLVVGVPLLLVRAVGNPLPASMPTLGEVERLLTQSGAGFETFLISVLAIVVWLVWAQIMIAVLIEAGSLIRGSAARTIPTFPGVQPFVSRLIASIAIVVTLSSGPMAPVAGALVLGPEAPSTQPYSPPPTTFTSSPDGPEGPEVSPAANGPVVIVDETVTLWDLAEAVTGDGLRWKDIVELNAGRQMEDGTVLTSGTTQLETGWDVVLPADASIAESSLLHVRSAESDRVAIEPGDHFWAIAEREVQRVDPSAPTVLVAEYWRALVKANTTSFAASGDPDMIHPGSTLILVDVSSHVAAVGTERSNQRVVGEGDNLWDISRDALRLRLGRDPSAAETREYWELVVAENLSQIGSHDPDIVRPGETISLPGAADPSSVGFGSPADGSLDLAFLAHAVAPDPAPDVTPVDVADAFVPPELFEYRAPTSSEGAAPSTKAASVGTQSEPKAPAVSSSAEDLPVPATAPDGNRALAATPSEIPPAVTRAAQDAAAASNSAGRRAPVFVTTGITATLAAALLWKLGLLRSIQQRLRRRDQVDSAPSTLALEIEDRLRSIEAPEALRWVCAMQQGLVGLHRSSTGEAPAIHMLRVGDQGFELLFEHTAPEPPEKFHAMDRVWGVADEMTIEAIEAMGSGHGSLMPALVTVGEQRTHPLLLDLERAGLVEVTGHGPGAHALLRSMAVELGSAPWSSDTEVLAIGLDPRLDSFPNVTVHEALTAGLINRLVLVAEETHDLLGSEQSTHSARCRPDAADPFAPVVVLIHSDKTIDQRLIDAASSPRSGLALVTTGFSKARWRVLIDADGAAHLEPLGLSMTAAGVDAATLGAIHDCIDGAQFVAAPLDLDDPSGDSGLVVIQDSTSPDTADVPDDQTAEALREAEATIDELTRPCGVELSIFGPPKLTGDIPQKISRRDVEITALLALKSAPPSVAVVTEAIFNRGAAFLPERAAPAPKTVLSAISRARTSLGTTASGERRLPRGSKDDAGYRLLDVGVDWLRCDALIKHAHAAPEPRSRMRLLQAALELVIGRPFSDVVDSYQWAFGDRDIASRIEAVTSDAASELAELALCFGDAELAGWAAARGVTVVRGHAELYRQMMRAFAVTDGPDGARRAYGEFTRVLHDIDPHEEPDDETVALLRELTSGHASRPAGPRLGTGDLSLA